MKTKKDYIVPLDKVERLAQILSRTSKVVLRRIKEGSISQTFSDDCETSARRKLYLSRLLEKKLKDNKPLMARELDDFRRMMVWTGGGQQKSIGSILSPKYDLEPLKTWTAETVYVCREVREVVGETQGSAFSNRNEEFNKEFKDKGLPQGVKTLHCQSIGHFISKEDQDREDKEREKISHWGESPNDDEATNEIAGHIKAACDLMYDNTVHRKKLVEALKKQSMNYNSADKIIDAMFLMMGYYPPPE